MKKILIAGCSVLVLCFICSVISGVLIQVSPSLVWDKVNKQKDLGVHYTEEDLTRMNEQYGFKYVEIKKDKPAEESIQFSENIDLEGTFTNEEVSAAINFWHDSWYLTPIKNVQFKVGDDGTIETSGLLLPERLYGYAAYSGYSEDEISQVREYIDKLNLVEIPVYATGTAVITDNEAEVVFKSVSFGPVPVPSSILNEGGPLFSQFIEDQILPMLGGSITSLEFKDGQTYLEGEIPSVRTSVK